MKRSHPSWLVRELRYVRFRRHRVSVGQEVEGQRSAGVEYNFQYCFNLRRRPFLRSRIGLPLRAHCPAWCLSPCCPWPLSREFICRKRSLALAVVHRGFPGEHVRDTAALLAIRARLYRRRGADVTAVAALITRVDRTHCCLSPPSADCGSCCCFHSAYRRTASILRISIAATVVTMPTRSMFSTSTRGARRLITSLVTLLSCERSSSVYAAASTASGHLKALRITKDCAVSRTRTSGLTCS